MRFLVTERLSEKIHKTPEGYLLCLDVPIARTGKQAYRPDEVGEGAEPGPDGMVWVDRPKEEVMRPETLASFAAKPVTVDHPDEDVTPANWKDLSHGTCTNVRQGQGDQIDLVLADLLIQSERAVSLVLGGLREISCGYDTDVEVTGPGAGVQRNIIGNHVALVQEGRCGSRCAIGDEKTMKENAPMAAKKKAGTMDKLARFLRLAKAMDALEEEQSEAAPEEKKDGEGSEEEKKDHTPEEMAALEERLERIEAAVAMLLEKVGGDATDEEAEGEGEMKGQDEEGEGEGEEKPEEKKSTGDKAAMQDIRSRAEIIRPGIDIKDSEKPCEAKRRTLSLAYIGDTKALIETFTGGAVKSFKALDKATVDAAFVGVSEVLRERNRRPAKDAKGSEAQAKDAKPLRIADMNAEHRKFWDAKRA
jgi:uncharacterized protein